MQNYSIYPIALCEGPRPNAHFAYRSEESGMVNTACYIWYIAGPGPKILVDAGADAEIFTSRGMAETDIISVKDSFDKLGIKPEDIDIVLVSHLHCDHIGLGHLFKNAVFVVQKKELEYARKPHPIDAILYDPGTWENLNLEVIDGDKEIVPNVSVILTPGHTPGGQSVEVGTTAGKAIITGFCSTLKTFSPTKSMQQRGWEVTLPTLHHDAIEAYNSVLLVKRRADIILPLHEQEFINGKRIP
jgi:N-acyl homoserine lactone hydrolase